MDETLFSLRDYLEDKKCKSGNLTLVEIEILSFLNEYIKKHLVLPKDLIEILDELGEMV